MHTTKAGITCSFCRYVSGKITTKFIEQEFPQGYKGHIVTEAEEMELMSVAAGIHTLKNLVC